MRALRSLGIGTAVERAGAVLRRWLFCDHRGEVLCEIDLEELWGDVGPFIGIERIKLQAALRLAAEDTPCRLGTRVTAVNQSNGQVAVDFSDRSNGDYDLVVGADGISSTLRQLSLSATPPVYGGQMAWRGIARSVRGA